MKSIFVLTFSLSILLSPNLDASTKTLADWANFQREADNLCRKNQHDDAIKIYDQVIKGRLPLQGNQHRDIGVAWNNLGVAFYSQGENERANDAYQQAIKILLPAVGADHPDILIVKTNIAFVEESKNNFETAEKSFRELLKRKLPIVGAQHPELADCQEGLALSLVGQEKLEEALSLLNKALSTRVKKFGPEHTDVGATHAAMAIIFLNQADFDSANKHDEEARKILSITRGTYPTNLNTVSRLRPGPTELLHAKNKDLRIP